jgi:hypothetical protein
MAETSLSIRTVMLGETRLALVSLIRPPELLLKDLKRPPTYMQEEKNNIRKSVRCKYCADL